MDDRHTRATAIRDHLLSLLRRAPDRRCSSGGLEFGTANFRLAFWASADWYYELVLWAPIPMLPEGREKVLALRWNASDLTVAEFQRGPWEGDVFSLRQAPEWSDAAL